MATVEVERQFLCGRMREPSQTSREMLTTIDELKQSKSNKLKVKLELNLRRNLIIERLRFESDGGDVREALLILH